ncbi:MAG: adenylyltransferase/cytidyltransferase family protein [Candidatus Micrarchaeaceae archaeon]|jgi:FAD synthetase
MKIVLAFGSFDFIHPGHLSYLAEAKKLGDKLIVIVSRDSSIRMIKHTNPLFDEKARVKMISSLKMVDKAVLGNKLNEPSDIYNIFKKYRPDVIALGYDQKANITEMRRQLVRYGINARIIRLHTKVNPRIYKSSKLVKRLSANKNK